MPAIYSCHEILPNKITEMTSTFSLVSCYIFNPVTHKRKGIG